MLSPSPSAQESAYSTELLQREEEYAGRSATGETPEGLGLVQEQISNLKKLLALARTLTQTEAEYDRAHKAGATPGELAHIQERINRLMKSIYQ